MKVIFAAAMLACASGANAAEGDKAVEAGSAGIAVELPRFDPELCVLTLAPKGNAFVLRAQSKSPSGWFRKGCEASVRVAPPVASPVRVDAGAGSTLFDALSGRAQAHAEAGNGSVVKS